MSYLSIRNLPPVLRRRLVEEAKIKQITKTQVVIEALYKAFGLLPESVKKRDLSQFAGKLSKKDLQAAQEGIEELRAIDESLWK